ncbi:MAG: hypothetical protein R3F30_09290 [Planctomycetota bacterium]
MLSSCPSQRGPAAPDFAVARGDERTVDLPADLRGLSLYGPAGRILVRAAERPRVAASFVVSATTEDEARRVAAGCDLAVVPEGDLTRVEVRLPEGHPIERIGVDFVVELPPGLDLRLATHGGPIDTTAYEAGSQELHSQDGDLHIGRTRTRLVFESRRGDVEILGSFGEASGSSEDGDLRVMSAARGGLLAFEATSSDIHLLPEPDASLEIVFDHLGAALFSNVPLRRETEALPDGWTRERLSVGEEGDCCRFAFRVREGKLVVGRD